MSTWPPPSPPLSVPYRSARGVAKALRAVLVVEIAALVGAVAGALTLQEPGRAGAAAAGYVLGGVVVLAAVGGWVLLIVLTKRLYRNLPLLRFELRYGASWAVWGWLVPFVNLARPKEIVDDIWLASNPGQREGRRLVEWWWGCWVVGFFVWWLRPMVAVLTWVVVGALVDDQDRRAAELGLATPPERRRHWPMPVAAAAAAIVAVAVTSAWTFGQPGR